MFTWENVVINLSLFLWFPSEKQIKYDSYLVPFTMYELGLLYKQQGEREKAVRYIETAK